MNKYLLLRDNKQSGPYSVNELAVHGLKAYDLVWLEGRSAAWRYPSEIEELKPFAPVVEEQPFDRFYKKPEIKSTEPALKDNTRVIKNTFSTEEIKKQDAFIPTKEYAGAKNNSTKKIHVSLPNTKPVESSYKSLTEQKQPDPTPLLRVTPVEKIKPVAEPVLMAEPISPVYDIKNDIVEPHASFEETYKKSRKKESTLNNVAAKDTPVSKLLFRSVAAACLLLGGALIGLVINYNQQQEKFQQLNQLVQEIKHQENPGSAKTAKNENISEELQPDVQEPVPAKNDAVYKEDIQIPLTKKDRLVKKTTDRGAINTADTQLIEPVTVPVVVKDESLQKVDKQSTELARKNLWQLVTVDNNTYKTGVFGGISNLSLKLSNKSLFQLEKVEVEILFLSPENKTVHKQKVVFENVSPGEQITLNVPKSNRGVKINHSIRKINTKEFGLAHAGM